MIINPYIYGVATSYDPDAQLFFNAQSGAGVTLTTTQMNAVNQWVVDAKAIGIWTKMKAVYPIVGGTATAHKFNLKNPLDTNAAFRLSFIGGWTHTSTGMTPNGTNAYANTFLNSGTDLTNTNNHISYYSRTATVGVVCEMGTYEGLTSSFFQVRAAGNYVSGNVSNAINFTTTGSALGFWLGTKRSNTDREVYRNGVSEATNTTSDSLALPNILIYLGARNSINYVPPGAQLFSSKECAFATIGDGLTDLESQLFYQITEKYQVALGRNINPTQTFYYNTAYNNETNAFLFSTQITDNTIQTATNTLVSDLKTANIWTKMKAVYPMVGGTSTTCKFNLKNPVDSNAAYRLTFFGGGTFSSNGYLPNGTNAYADTFFIPSTNLTDSNNHLSYYSRTDAVAANVCEIGSYNNASPAFQFFGMQTKFTGNLFLCANGVNPYPTVSNTNSQGLHLMTKNGSSTQLNAFKNATKVITNGTTGAGSSTTSVYIGAFNANGPAANYTTKQCAFASIGDGLTDAEALAYYNAVQTFNTTLGRQV